jgi:hypothetical protein
MATNQALREGIYEGILYIGLKAYEAMEACDVVELSSTAGYVVKATSSGVPFGFVAEQVTAAGIPDYYPGGLVSHTAKVGDYVGVYVCGGILNHHDATAATFGAVLYAGTTTAGKCATSSSTSANKVGICVVAKDTTTGNCKLKSYL